MPGAGVRLGSVVADRVYDLERCGATGHEAQSTALADFLAGGSAALAAARQALARGVESGQHGGAER